MSRFLREEWLMVWEESAWIGNSQKWGWHLAASQSKVKSEVTV